MTVPLVQSLLNGEENDFDLAVVSPISIDVGLYLAREVLQVPFLHFHFGMCVGFILTPLFY